MSSVRTVNAIKNLEEALQGMMDKSLNMQKVMANQLNQMLLVEKATKSVEKATTQATKAQEGYAKKFEKGADGAREYHNVFGMLFDKLTSTSEEVKLFGFHAQTTRRIMYGFLPRGMFRMVNKLSVAFKFVDIQLRKMGKSSKDGKKELGFLGKAYKKIGKMTDLSEIGRLKEKRKEFEDLAKNQISKSTTWNTGGRASPLSSSRIPADRFQTSAQNYMKAASGAKKQRRQEIGHVLTAGVFRKQAKLDRLKARKDRKEAIVKGWKGIGGVKGIWKGVKNFMTVVLRSALFFTQMAFLAILTIGAFFVLWKEFKEPIMLIITAVWNTIVWGFNTMWEGIKLIWEGAELLFSAFFGDGDFGDAIQGVLHLLEGLGLFVIGLITAFIGPALVALGGLVMELGGWAIAKVVGWLESFWEGDFKTKVKMVLKFLAAGLILWAMIAMYQAGIGIAIVVGLGVVLWKIAKWIVDWIPGLAGGGAGSGLTVVGENGPELVALPKGSKVHSNKDSRKMASSGTVNNFNITINAKDTSDAEMRRVADKIGKMLNNNVNRRTPSGTMR